MLDDKKRAELDQAIQAVSEFLPPMWRRLYVELVAAKFTELQALELVKTYIMATSK